MPLSLSFLLPMPATVFNLDCSSTPCYSHCFSFTFHWLFAAASASLDYSRSAAIASSLLIDWACANCSWTLDVQTLQHSPTRTFHFLLFGSFPMLTLAHHLVCCASALFTCSMHTCSFNQCALTLGTRAYSCSFNPLLTFLLLPYCRKYLMSSVSIPSSFNKCLIGSAC